MRRALAWAALRRHPIRTLLAVCGVAVSAAMLLDMLMLATGMQVSFRALLVRQGFDMRLAPKGTLPFDTEARIPRAAVAESSLRAIPNVRSISPVLGTTLHAVDDSTAVATFALGIRPEVQGDYELSSGRDVTEPNAVVANDEFLRRAGRHMGDTITIAAGYDAQLRTWTARRRATISGRAHFLYLAVDQPAIALPIASLQQMSGADEALRDRVSLFMVKLAAGTNIDAVRVEAERRVPQATAIATIDAVKSVEDRLAYFRQLSFILGTISLIVGFLLVSTLVTVSVQERIGEMAVMRAIGVSRPHIAQQVMIEGLGISIAGAALGLVLGIATAEYLNAILRDFPGLPAAIDFFVFEPVSAYRAFGLLIVTAVAAGGFPAWRAASLPIASTLRAEAVS